MDSDPFHREFDRSLSKTDLFRILKIAIKRHRCKAFAIIDLDRLGSGSASIGTSTVLEMIETMPVAPDEALPVSNLTLEWLCKNRGFAALTQDDDRLGDLARHYQARCAYVFPTIGKSGCRHTLIVTTDGDEPVQADMIFDVTAILFRLIPLIAADHDEVSLSTREIETIEWTAAGKTSGEIATILGLSEYTINEYVGSAMKKTNAVNRIHLVANSIRSGVIS